MRRAIHRLCGGGSSEDIVQEVFLGLWSHPQRFDVTRGSLQNFLVMQAYRRAVDSTRSTIRRHAREASETRRRIIIGVEVEAAVVAGLAHEQLGPALASIPELQRQAVVLAFFGGHTYREVAELLGRPVGTVKTQIRTGLLRLRSSLTDADVGVPSDRPADVSTRWRTVGRPIMEAT